jgi:prepilin-type N-terminal cleavage/methylation domain-containing protein
MGRLRTEAHDEGFTLVEVLTALAVIAIVVASVTTFFVNGLRRTHHQGQRQVAAQIALDGLERARALRGSGIITGRTQCTSCATAFPAAMTPYQAGMVRYDNEVGGAAVLKPRQGIGVSGDVDETGHGAAAAYPFTRYISVGRCYRAGPSADCIATGTTGAFFRVVVGVTWAGAECGGTCAHVTAALFSATSVDPLFQVS